MTQYKGKLTLALIKRWHTDLNRAKYRFVGL